MKTKYTFLICALISVIVFASCNHGVGDESTGSVKMILSDHSVIFGKNATGGITMSGTPFASEEVDHYTLEVSPAAGSTGPGYSKIGDSVKSAEANSADILLESTQVELSYGKWNFALAAYNASGEELGMLDSVITVSENSIVGDNIEYAFGVLVCAIPVSNGSKCYFDASGSLDNITLKYNGISVSSPWTKEFNKKADGTGDTVTGSQYQLEAGTEYKFYFCVKYNGTLYGDSTELIIPSAARGNVYKIPENSEYSINNCSFTIQSDSSISFVPAFKHENGKLSFELDSRANNSDIWLVLANATGNAVTKPSGLATVSSVEMCRDMLVCDYSYLLSSEPTEINVDPNPPLIVGINPDRMRSVEVGNEYSEEPAVGSKDEFFVEGWSGKVKATLMEYRTVNTANGTRHLAVYVQDNMTCPDDPNIPDADDVAVISDAFLKDGMDNDIYDKITGMFGNDIGYYNTHSGNPYKDGWETAVIGDVDTITLLYCDIDRQGDLSGMSSYIAGYYGSADYFVNGEVKVRYSDGSVRLLDDSNERAMVFLHAHRSGGQYLGKSLTTLSHEFQHLVHAQYFNGNFPGTIPGRTGDSTSTNEMFSSIAESYTAQFIHEKSGKSVPGPFYVGDGGNELGYMPSGTAGDWYCNGRGPYTLASLGKSQSFSAWNGNLYDYGKVASLGFYILVNYGDAVIKDYMEKGYPDLDGIIRSINRIDNTKINKVAFLSNYGASLLLSSRAGLEKPYRFNRKGWYVVNGMKVPSVNIWQYEDVDKKSFGIRNSSASSFGSETVNLFKVKSNVSGHITVDGVPEMGKLSLTVVAVPHAE